MNLATVIRQLKAVAVTNTLFSGNIAGAAEFRSVVDQTWLTLPACYVLPLDDEAGENENENALFQVVTDRVMVIVVFENSTPAAAGDRRGQTVSELFEPTKWTLFKALLNWRPNDTIDNPDKPTGPGAVTLATLGINHSTKGLRYVGGSLRDDLLPNLSRLAYQYTFALDVQISEDDGWQPTGVPLVDIPGHLADPETGTIDIVGFDVSLPTS